MKQLISPRSLLKHYCSWILISCDASQNGIAVVSCLKITRSSQLVSFGLPNCWTHQYGMLRPWTPGVTLQFTASAPKHHLNYPPNKTWPSHEFGSKKEAKMIDECDEMDFSFCKSSWNPEWESLVGLDQKTLYIEQFASDIAIWNVSDYICKHTPSTVQHNIHNLKNVRATSITCNCCIRINQSRFKHLETFEVSPFAAIGW